MKRSCFGGGGGMEDLEGLRGSVKTLMYNFSRTECWMTSTTWRGSSGGEVNSRAGKAPSSKAC